MLDFKLEEIQAIEMLWTLVLNNIAQGYKLKGDKENAIKYYQLTEKYGDETAKQGARREIEKLNK